MDFIHLADIFEKAAKKKPWNKKPEGWTERSVGKYTKTLTEEAEHPFTKCVEKLKGKSNITDPKRFCGSLKNRMKKNK